MECYVKSLNKKTHLQLFRSYVLLRLLQHHQEKQLIFLAKEMHPSWISIVLVVVSEGVILNAKWLVPNHGI